MGGSDFTKTSFLERRAMLRSNVFTSSRHVNIVHDPANSNLPVENSKGNNEPQLATPNYGS